MHTCILVHIYDISIEKHCMPFDASHNGYRAGLFVWLNQYLQGPFYDSSSYKYLYIVSFGKMQIYSCHHYGNIWHTTCKHCST